jgi:predicted CXXCH cytochrome family protein
MPAGGGATTGYTRLLGTDLTNDHPISITYSDTLATRDGELRSPTMSTGLQGQTLNRWGTVFGARQPFDSYKPLLPLEPLGAGSAGQVQCTTCHDPHIRETDSGTTGTGEGNIKFLRANRFQRDQPTSTYSATNDIICLACHDKGAGGNSWAYSAHANKQVATQTYTSAAATTREFPKSGDAGITADLPVWRAACLNCHDTHTVAGARRLTREGASGGNSAIEETCYQCHSSTGIVTPLTTVPNIKTDFTAVGNKRMPIANTTEVHEIGGNFNDATFNDCTGTANKCGADFIESRANLGLTDLTKRHAECTDCHNPHRVIKYKNGLPGDLTALTFNNTGLSASGTHKHTDDATDIHSNLISGVLRGSWGVEPTYSSLSFHVRPSGFTVKRGDPGASALTAVTQGYVTREYQICLKCHSDYSYSDDDLYPNSANRPQLGGAGLTAANANGHANYTSYTNQAKEFQAPSTHAVSVGSVSLGIEAGTGPYVGANNNPRDNNHRSWHPVMAPTGRTGRAGEWIAPWNNSGTGGKAGRLGVQTMYCSDCHGSSTGSAASVIPTGGEHGSPWGPHGSSNNFLLKGDWSTSSGEGDSNTLCFKCHSQSAYSGGGGTGFQTDKGDGHAVHSNRIDNDMKCNFCHVAVPHGWKNRNLLVNLLDVGAEAGLPAGTAVSYTNNTGYTNGPYYRKAFLRIRSFPAAGNQWTESNCNGGSKSTMKTNCEQPN